MMEPEEHLSWIPDDRLHITSGQGNTEEQESITNNKKKNQDVYKNEWKFIGDVTKETENRGIRKFLIMLLIKRGHFKPLRCMEWLQKTNWTIQSNESTKKTTDRSEKDRTITNFEN